MWYLVALLTLTAAFFALFLLGSFLSLEGRARRLKLPQTYE